MSFVEPDPIEEARRRFQSALTTGVVENPDQLAQDRREAAARGLPVETLRDARSVAPLPPLVNFQALEQNNPRTMTWLSEPANAAVAHDDIENMSAVENVVRGVGARAVNLLADSFDAFTTYTDKPLDALRQFYDDLGIPQYDILGTRIENGRVVVPRQDVQAEIAAIGGVREQRLTRQGQSVTFGYAPGTTWEEVKVQPVQSIIPFALEQGIVSVPDMVLAVTSLPNYLMARTGGIAQDRAANNGQQEATVEDLLAALPAASASALLERLGTRGIIGLDDAVKGGARGILPAAGRAAVLEAGTEAAQNVIEYAGGTLGTETGFDPTMALDQALQGVAAGGPFGGTVRAATATAEVVTERVRARQNEAAAADSEGQIIDNLAQLSEASKLRERAPETFQQFIDHTAADGPAENIYVDAATFAQALNEAGVSIEDVTAEIPSLAEQLPAALATGGDIRLSAGEYAARIAGTDAGPALLEHLRIDPFSMSRAQAAEFVKTQGETLQAEVERAVAEGMTDEAFRASADVVRSNMVDQLNRAGRFTSDVNNAYASLVSNFYAVQAAKLGITPEQMAERYPLRVSSELPGSQTGTRMDQQGDTLELVHYSNDAGLTMSDPTQWGSTRATPDSERVRRNAGAPMRTYFGVSGVYTGELGAGIGRRPNAYVARVPRSKIYDFDADPQNLKPTEGSPLERATAYEQAIQAAGFLGYRSDAAVPGAVAVFDPVPLTEYGGEPLAGAPASDKPFMRARRAAEAYMAANGLRYEPPTTYAKLDKDRAARIAQAFDEMKHDPSDPEVAAAYQALISETMAQWREIKATGLKVEFITGEDPYAASPRMAIEDVRENNHLWVFPTDDGFGSSEMDVSDNPLLELTTEYISGKRMRVNDVFRIVHDYFGHIKEGTGFRAEGEENAWQSHAAMFTPLARRAMTTETRGQNSWVNYGPHGEKNRTASSADTVYADQKIGLLPEWVSEEGFLGGPNTGEPRGVSTEATLNIGLKIDARAEIMDVSRAMDALAEVGAKVISSGVSQSTTEPTLVVRLAEPLSYDRATQLSATLEQDAIAQRRADGRGELYGPKADAWRPFDAAYFLEAGGASFNQSAAETISKLGDTVPGIAGVAPYLTNEERARLKKNSAKKLVDFVQSLPSADEMASVAYAGRAKRGWYERSANALLEIFGAEDATRFAALLAALSPQTSVESNTFNALATWVNWNKAGRPTGRKEIIQVLGESVEGDKGVASVLDAWINNSVRALASDTPAGLDLSGAKVNSFFSNLVGAVDEVTNDAWMGAYAATPASKLRGPEGADDFGRVERKGIGYIAMNAVVRRAAEVLSTRTGESWTPSEVQETVWSWAKTLYERRDSMNETTEEILAMGGLRHEDIANTPDFALLFTNGVFRRILEAGGYGQELEAVAAREQDGRSAARQGNAADAEGAGVAEDVFAADLQAAARRLEQVRTARRQAAAERKGTAQPDAQMTLFQPNRGQIQFGGDITQSPSVISLLQTADLSTFLHETGHFFLEVTAHIANAEDAPADIRADMDTVLSWFRPGLTLAEWNTFDAEAQRPYHEQFARGFEAYLFEGRSPSTAMRDLFRRFSAWLKNVYKTLTGLDVTLTDDVRSVMDRLIASQDEIRVAEEARSFAPLFATRPEGMTEDEWARYQELGGDATAEAIEQLEQRSARGMRWASGAKDRYVKQLQGEANDQRKAIRAEVTAEVEAEPVNRARAFLRRGIGENGEPVEGAQKLSLPVLKELYGEDGAWTRLRRGGKYGEVAEDGAHPDMVAEMFGYPNGTALIEDLVNGEIAADKIKGLTDQRMLERYGDLSDPQAVERAANEAVANDARAKFVAAEMAALDKAVGKRSILNEAARDYAAGVVNRLELKRLKPAQYLAAQGRAARDAEKAVRKDDLAAAATAKRNQLINLHIGRAVQQAAKDVEKTNRLFTRIISAKDDNVAKSRNMDLVNAARAILMAYGIGRVKNDPQKYMDALKAYDPTLYADLEPFVQGARGDAKPLPEITYEQFQALRDTVGQLWTMSRRIRQVEIDGKLVDRAAVIEQLGGRLEEIGLPDSVAGETRAATDSEHKIRDLLGIRAALRRVESWARGIDGSDNGPFRKFIWNPISTAADAYRAESGAYIRRFRALVESVRDQLKPRDIVAPEIGYTFGGKAELYHALLHTGNGSNKSKLLLGRRWGRKLADGSLDDSRWNALIDRLVAEGVLTKQDFDFVQSVWDLLEETKPGAQKAHRTVYGRYFDEIAADPVETPFGTYRGGYVPALTDAFLVQDAALRAEQEAIEGGDSAMFPAASNGFTKSRVEDYTRELALDLRLLPAHIDKVLKFTHLGPPVRDVARLLKDRGFARKLQAFDPTAQTDLLLPWLQRAAKQLVETPSKGRAGKAADRFFSAVRSRVGMQLMFANVVNTAQQVTGFSNVLLRVEASNVSGALWRYVRDPKGMTEAATGLSQFLTNRMNTDIFEARQTITQLTRLDPSKRQELVDFAQRHAYFMQSALQNVMDVVSWSAAYDQAVARGDTDREAVRFADSVIRETQGTMAPEDVSRFETGTPFVRVFTQFAGYFNMMANLNATEVQLVARDVGLRKGAGRLFYVYLMGFAVPAILGDLIAKTLRGGFEDEDDDGYMDDILTWFFSSQAKFALAAVPVVGQAANAAIGAFTDAPYDDRISMSPAVSVIESAAGVPAELYQSVVEGESFNRADVRDTLNLLGVLTGTPAGVLAKPVGYGVGVAQGDIEPTGPVDAARGVVTGAPSPESRQ